MRTRFGAILGLMQLNFLSFQPAHENYVKKLQTQRIAQPTVLTNLEIVVLAAYLAGAETALADTEDIAISANVLAPGRFAWRKYKEQINIDAVRKRLWDATKPEKGAYLSGSEKLGWRLTKAGFDFAHFHMSSGSLGLIKRAPMSKNERSAKMREIARMKNEEAFKYRWVRQTQSQDLKRRDFFALTIT